MARLGISVYPEHSTKEKDMEYIRKAGRLGYKRIFTCLLSVKESREEVTGRFADWQMKPTPGVWRSYRM